MNESQKISKMEKFIHVTGFGPFRGFTDTNPSWEAVSLLPDEICVNNVKYTIKKHNVLVTYGAVNDIVPKLWASKPTVSRNESFLVENVFVFFSCDILVNYVTSAIFQLVVHCGADHSAKAIKMEQSAYNGHFCEADFEGKYLDEHNVCLEKSGKCIKLCTHLNLNQIINDCGDHNLEHSMHPGK